MSESRPPQRAISGMAHWGTLFCGVAGLAGLLEPVSLLAQPPGVVVQGQPMPGGPPGGQPGRPPMGAPNQQGAPNAGGKPEDGAKKEEGAAAGPAPVSRSDRPATSAADRKELAVRPNPDGKLQINFHGQKWLDVLEWYADISGLSLDWQEVPGDYLNLRTQRQYTVAEVRDVLNRHLLDRGFTLLRSGEILMVANLKKLDPSLVPRVMPEDLANLQPHEFARTSFKLDWLIAETTVEELKPLLSPYGKLWALKATNRVEALDAAANLMAIQNVLQDEQSGHGQERLVREFRLQHSRAEDVYDLLLGLLGKEKPKKDDGPMDARRMMQMQQQMMQMQQQQGQRPPGDGNKKPMDIHLVVNLRDNSILVNGPPDQVAVVEQAVKQLDVPPDAGRSLLQNPTRMQIYRLTAIDPEPLVETLKQVGNLDPATQLRVDKKNRSIIAYASLADHVVIRAMVDKLDGTDRRFEVIRLRKLEAEYVAGSIQFMMGEAEEKQQNRRSYSFYDPFASMSGDSSEQNATRKFRVDADVEHNRLLIWANDIELQEIENLLIKLGELPPAGSRSSTLRTLESIPLEDAPYLLERLREAWPGMGENPLQLNVQPHPPVKRDEAAPPEAPRTGLGTSTRMDPTQFFEEQTPLFRFSKASVSRTGESAVAKPSAPVAPSSPLLAEAGREAAAETPATAAGDERKTPPVTASEPATGGAPAVVAEPNTPAGPRLGQGQPGAPVVIELDEQGRWTLRSQDTAALDRLEDLIAELAPPRRDYKLFQLQHSTSWAYGIALTLEDFFKEEPEKPAQRRPYWYYDSSENNASKDKSRRLSNRRPLKFIADSDSNSILVVGADPHQLRIIEDLIEYYDQPVASDAKAMRRTEIFQIQHSQAETIADAIKDVYRDLLSENDKALQKPNGQDQNQQRASERTVTYVYDSFGDEGDKKGGEPPAPIRFKGALSIGVDPLSNSLVISATESLLTNIRELIKQLDQAAQPKTPTMRVLQVDRNIPVDVVQEKLAKLLKEQQQRRRQQQQQPPQVPQPGQPVQAEGRGPFD